MHALEFFYDSFEVSIELHLICNPRAMVHVLYQDRQTFQSWGAFTRFTIFMHALDQERILSTSWTKKH